MLKKFVTRHSFFYALCLYGGLLFIHIPTRVFGEPAPAPRSPSETIRQAIDVMREVVIAEQGKIPESDLDEKLKKIIYPVFDFREMSRRSVGKNWHDASAAEQEEFVDLFSAMLGRTYLKRIKNGITTNTIDFTNEVVQEKRAFLKTVATTKEESVSIDYRMQLRNDQWRIYDVIIENVGLVSNYRNEFSGIIRKEKFSGLLKRLREKKHENEVIDQV